MAASITVVSASTEVGASPLHAVPVTIEQQPQQQHQSHSHSQPEIAEMEPSVTIEQQPQQEQLQQELPQQDQSQEQPQIRHFFNMPDLGHYSDEEMKILFGPGTKSGMYLRTCQVAFMVAVLITSFFIDSFYMTTNNRIFISGVSLNLLWGILYLIQDFNAKRNTLENGLPRVIMLLIGNLVIEWYSLFALSLGASYYFFVLVDLRFYVHYLRGVAHMFAASIFISLLGWLCTFVSSMALLSIALKSKIFVPVKIE